MTLTEIKKGLYKEKPVAKLLNKDATNYFYQSEVSGETISFTVPISDMGEKLFSENEPAQLLIRWIDNN